MVENVNVLMSYKGTVLKNDVQGVIKIKALLSVIYIININMHIIINIKMHIIINIKMHIWKMYNKYMYIIGDAGMQIRDER